MSLSASHSTLPDLPTLDDRQFRLWEDMLENRTGVRISLGQDSMSTQIVKRMAEGGWADADSYFRDMLETPIGAREWGILLDRLLVKETRFFRHQASHDYVRERVACHAASASNSSSAQAFNIWSAGCASGEEAYSLAVDAAEGFASAGRAENYYIVGTDISAGAITTARRGIYTDRCLAELPAKLQAKYFSVLDEERLKIVSAVRQRIAFLVANLLERPVRYYQQMDLIYCQNVLVYFKQWRRRDVVKFFQDCLKPGGCLILGPGELTDWLPENMERIDISNIQAYQKRLK